MAKNFSPRAHKLLAVFAQDEAKKSGSDQLLPEHFILALLKSADGLGYLLLQQLRINVLTLQLAVEQSLIQKTNTVQFSDVPVSRRMRTILDAASVESRTVRKDYIGTEHLVVAAVREEYSVTARFFSKADISIDDIYAALAAVYDKFQSSYDVSRMKAAAGALFPALEAAGKTDRSRNERTVGHSILAEFSRDLTALARSRSLDPVIGRETEIKRMVQILSRRTKNNPVLIGDPGVGKTALVEGIAYRIQNRMVPECLLDKRILMINTSELIADAKYRGEFEERVESLLKAIREDKNTILFLDEIHTVKGTGASSSDGLDFMNMLKPYLSRGDIQMIGATTTEEYQKYFAMDDAFRRRFDTITLKEPENDILYSILNGSISRYEELTGVEFAFNNDEKMRIFDTLIQGTDKKGRVNDDMQYNPHLVLSVLEKSFAFASFHEHDQVDLEDVCDAISSCERIYESRRERLVSRLRGKFPNTVEVEGKPYVKSNIISFPQR